VISVGKAFGPGSLSELTFSCICRIRGALETFYAIFAGTMKKYLHGHLLVHTVSRKLSKFPFPNCQNNLFKFFSPIVHSNVKSVRKAVNLEENWFSIALVIIL
jgi:hypothetical protein